MISESPVTRHGYQRVVRRKPVPYLPSPKNPKYLLYYVEEELECGHKVVAHADDTLTARTRNCHECAGCFGGLKLPSKKKAQSIQRAIDRQRQQAGKECGPFRKAA